MYYIFDILWANGYSLEELPLQSRQEILAALITENETLKISKAFQTNGHEFLAAAKKMRLEGVIAKQLDSTYSPGIRSKQWLKIKSSLRQEVVIGGYTLNEGSSKPFSALLVGVYNNKKLEYT